MFDCCDADFLLLVQLRFITFLRCIRICLLVKPSGSCENIDINIKLNYGSS